MEHKNIAILGANGIVGSSLLEMLRKNFNGHIYAMARSFNNKTEGNVTYEKVDLLNKQETEDALRVVDLVFLVVGLAYNINVWRKDWPVIMRNVINASIKSNSKLVFFDNVYAYGKVNGIITEEQSITPISKKGEVRAKLIGMLEHAHAQENLTYVIARSADFYGPHAKNSTIYPVFVENMLQNKNPYVLGDIDKKHSLTYIPDAIKALATLGFDQKANNDSWHLPTKDPPYTIRQYIEIINCLLGTHLKPNTAPKIMIQIIGLVNPMMKEIPEMLYQYEYDYIFDSSKYEKTFGDVIPTGYEDGLKEMINSFR